LQSFHYGAHSPRRIRATALAVVVLIFACTASFERAAQQQQPKEKKPAEKQDQKGSEKKQEELIRKDDTTLPTGKEIKKQGKNETKLSPVESIVELAIYAYGGRKQLETARSAIVEEGTIRLVTETGDLTGKYLLRSMRREKSWLDLLRVDLELNPPGSTDRPGAAEVLKYTIAFNGASVWSAQNGQYINPAPRAEAAFRAQLTHEYMALLRYKEDGSKIELAGPETVVGIPTNMVDLTLPSGEKTRFWISSKSYRIVHAEYELSLPGDPKPTKYHIAYYYAPFKVVQNTLVPTRREMTQDGKLVQEIVLGPITYSAKLDPEIFQHLQEQ